MISLHETNCIQCLWRFDILGRIEREPNWDSLSEKLGQQEVKIQTRFSLPRDISVKRTCAPSLTQSQCSFEKILQNAIATTTLLFSKEVFHVLSTFLKSAEILFIIQEISNNIVFILFFFHSLVSYTKTQCSPNQD